jgi:phosphate transport system substrate-binding protein
MISFSTVSRRSTVRGTVLATSLVLLTLLLGACGGSNPVVNAGPVPNTVNPDAKTCSISTADLGTGGSTKATAPNDKATGTITIDDSPELQPLLTQAQTEYLAANKNAKITVNANNSTQSLTDLEGGKVQIGNTDVFAKTVNATSYTNLTDNQVAVAVFAVVVNPDVAAYITNLTTQQIQQIFEGQIDNWNQIGGLNEHITVIGRPSSSDTDGTFVKYVLQGATASALLSVQDTNASVGDAVSSTPGSISYIATSFIGTGGKYNGKVVPVCIDGQKPSPDQVASNAYQFWTIEHMYTKGAATGLAASFIKYIQSTAFQTNDVPGLYFLPTNKLSAAAQQAHQP